MGFEVGDAVGAYVGFDGREVGDLVGIFVGTVVGVLVGTAVGVNDGFDGRKVGHLVVTVVGTVGDICATTTAMCDKRRYPRVRSNIISTLIVLFFGPNNET